MPETPPEPIVDPIPQLGRSPGIRVRRRVWLPPLLVYAVSFLLPTISLPYYELVPGYQVFYETLVRGVSGGVLVVLAAWSANLLFLTGTVFLIAGRVRWATAISWLALATALIPARWFVQIVQQLFKAGSLIDLAKIPGYFTWVGSMAMLAIIAGYLAGRDEQGRFRPQPKLGHLMYAVGLVAVVIWGWQNCVRVLTTSSGPSCLDRTAWT